tara:strand:- start:815 stop:1042 length:228 start_codon:yes stop_codon:yes gene_type:complete
MKITKIHNINVKIYDAVANLREIQEEAQDTLDNRSEAWLESDKGEEYSERLQELEAAIDEIENGQAAVQEVLDQI